MQFMVRMTVAVAFFLVPVFQAQSTTQEEGGGIVFSIQCHGMLAPVPEGWVLDNEMSAAQGVDMLFYPNGAIGKEGVFDSSLILYVMPAVKEHKGRAESTAGLIASAQKALEAEDPGAQTRVDAPIASLAGDMHMTTLHVDAPRIPLFEEVTYLEDKDVIFAVILSAKNRQRLAERAGLSQWLARQARILPPESAGPPCRSPRGLPPGP